MNTMLHQWFACQAAETIDPDIHMWMAGNYADQSHYWQGIVWC